MSDDPKCTNCGHLLSVHYYGDAPCVGAGSLDKPACGCRNFSTKEKTYTQAEVDVLLARHEAEVAAAYEDAIQTADEGRMGRGGAFAVAAEMRKRIPAAAKRALNATIAAAYRDAASIFGTDKQDEWPASAILDKMPMDARTALDKLLAKATGDGAVRIHAVLVETARDAGMGSPEFCEGEYPADPKGEATADWLERMIAQARAEGAATARLEALAEVKLIVTLERARWPQGVPAAAENWYIMGLIRDALNGYRDACTDRIEALAAKAHP